MTKDNQLSTSNRGAYQDDFPDARTVVVTGASTGIGYGVAQELIAHGYRVIGTVRKKEDADRLRAELGARFQPVLVDVADDEEVSRAADEIREMVGDRGLAGLVNNAGIAVAGPLMHVDLEELRYQFDVNVVSVVAMTQALLPLLGGRREITHPPGRVINISSVSAYTTYPFMAPYAASKHALESISDGMRRELALYGIDVIVLVLGAVQTPIWEKTSDADLARYAATDYAEGVAQMRATASGLGQEGMPVTRVAQAVRQILEQPKSKPRHILVNDYWRGWLLPRLIPTRLYDWAMTKQFGLKRSALDND
ncbi:MAG: SDR family oxidoreductase [Caldilineaceae bacterium]|nr:SDR family oxidoreductase [Caldilineaceae bacterium]